MRLRDALAIAEVRRSRATLVKVTSVWQNIPMSFAEMKEALVTLSPEQRAELQESLYALEEGVSVQELRAMNAALDEELKAPSPGLSVEEVRQSVRSLRRGDGA